MARSVWKGPYVQYSMFKKCFLWKIRVVTLTYLFCNSKKDVAIRLRLSNFVRSLCSRTWVMRSRSCRILPMFFNMVYLVHTGRLHVPVTVRGNVDPFFYFSTNFGNFAPTRTFSQEHRSAKKRKA